MPESTRRAPTRQQLAILKLLAGGCELHAPKPGAVRYRLQFKKGLVSTVCLSTITQLEDAGWIARAVGSRFMLTVDGRAQAEVGAFVRHFASEVAS